MAQKILYQFSWLLNNWILYHACIVYVCSCYVISANEVSNFNVKHISLGYKTFEIQVKQEALQNLK